MDRQNSDDVMRFVEGMASSDDVLFGFLDDGNSSPENSLNSSGDFEFDEDDETICNPEEEKAYWEEQEQLIQAALYRTSSIESKIRHATKEALKEVNAGSLQCVCSRPSAGGCRKCLRREVSLHLQNAGYNCVVCKSKWRSSKEIPSGEHEFLEVVDKSNSSRGEIRVVIELSFRIEFEMAKGSEEYKELICKLPEVYVGKTERLKSLIKILCGAAKKCMKDKKLHMGPWRKHKYMQAKWFGTCQRSAPPAPEPETETENYSEQLPVKPRASMLKFGLFNGLPGVQCPAVAVV